MRSTSVAGACFIDSRGSVIVQKRCTNCRKEYFARWRNEPVELCPDCRVGALLCPTCSAVTRSPADPDQLPLFPGYYVPPPSRIESPSVEERYWSLRAKASQAERRRYPYH